MILRIFLGILGLLVVLTIFWGRPPEERPQTSQENFAPDTEVPSTAILVLDGQVILADQQGWIRIFNAGHSTPHTKFMAHGGAIHALRKTPSGFATASIDGTIRVWGPKGEALSIHRLFEYHFNDAVVTTNSAVIAAADKGTVARVDDETKWVQRLAHRKAAFKLALSPDETQVASVGEDGFLRIWSVGNGEKVSAWKAHQGLSSVVAWQGQNIVTGGTVENREAQRVEGELRFWNLDGTQTRAAIKVPYAPITRLALSEGFIAVLGEGDSVTLYDRTSGQHLKTVRFPPGPIFGLSIVDDSIYIGLPNGQFKTWHVTNGP